MTVIDGELIARRHDDGHVEIVQAPCRARMSLGMLASADPAVVKVSGNTVTLAGQVTYRVTGWEPNVLLLQMWEDLRGR